MSNARNLARLKPNSSGLLTATYLDVATLPAGSATGTIVPFGGDSVPTDWLLCFGQAVSRTTYSALFTVLGTTYGSGDGSTTFNLPDLRGRVPGGKDDMGGAAASRLNVTLTGTRASTGNGTITGLSSTAGLSVGMKAFGTGIGTNATITSIVSATSVTLSVNNTATGSGSIRFALVDGATLGATGGDHIHTLSVAQMPAHTHTESGSGSGNNYSASDPPSGGVVSSTTGSTGGGQAHPNLQPTIIVNYIIKT